VEVLGKGRPTGDRSEPRLDLARDLANKLVRPSRAGFVTARLADAEKIEYFLVYFGAHWCPNSNKFTPKLTQFYREQRSARSNFEVIFVSADKDEEAMLHYMTGYKMPWPAVRFGEHKGIASIRALAGRGYPCVVLVDSKGEVLAHSYGEGGAGKYIGPLKPMEKLEEILERKRPKTVARAGR
jgi:nucleoredoxin